MKQLCIVCVVNAKYERFIPIFALSIFRAYPDYAVRIYIQDQLSRKIQRAVDMVREEGSLEIVPNCLDGYPNTPQVFKSLRWVLHDEAFYDYEHVYFGDIDMFMCRETPSLLDFHVDRCKRVGLPYSNVVRPDSERLSGLHFVITKPYFEGTLETIRQYDEMLKQDRLKLADKGGNEKLLYEMMEKSIGLPPPCTKEEFGKQRPHHGIHLGLWRGRFSKQAPSPWMSRDQHADYFSQFMQIYECPRGKQVFQLCRAPEVKRMSKQYRLHLS